MRKVRESDFSILIKILSTRVVCDYNVCRNLSSFLPRTEQTVLLSNLSVRVPSVLGRDICAESRIASLALWYRLGHEAVLCGIAYRLKPYMARKTLTEAMEQAKFRVNFSFSGKVLQNSGTLNDRPGD